MTDSHSIEAKGSTTSDRLVSTATCLAVTLLGRLSISPYNVRTVSNGDNGDVEVIDGIPRYDLDQNQIIHLVAAAFSSGLAGPLNRQSHEELKTAIEKLKTGNENW